MFKIFHNSKLLPRIIFNTKRMRGIFIFLIIIVVLFITYFLFFNFNKHGLAFTGENLGGWAWSAYEDNNDKYGAGWISESCNNTYYGINQDYCGIEITPIIDANFDGDSVDFQKGIIEAGEYDGEIIGLSISDIRNGGKNTKSEIELATRDSNFNNSFYFKGSYLDNPLPKPPIYIGNLINFGNDNAFNLKNMADEISASIWFRFDEDTEDSFLFSNGCLKPQKDTMYYCYFLSEKRILTCGVNGDSGDGASEIEEELFGEGTLKIESKPLDPNEWYNVTIVYDAGIFYMYLNGLEIGKKKSKRFDWTGVSVDLILGAGKIDSSYSDYGLNFKGELDEFRLFDFALDKAQVLHNIHHNSNYLLNIEADGEMTGWAWSSNVGWICFGTTCSPYGMAPDGSLPKAKLHWVPDQANDIYPHMITGWANAISFNNYGGYGDAGWISLQKNEVLVPSYDNYIDCMSCSFRDEENGLVGYWKMDEDSGLIASDSSEFGNNMTVSNFSEEPWFENGRINNCINFYNSEGYLNIGVIGTLLDMGLSDFSIEIWAKDNDLDYENDHISLMSGIGADNWDLYFNALKNQLHFTFLQGTKVSAKVIDFNEWRHIVVLVDRDSNLKMYIDGSEFIGDNINTEEIRSDTLDITSFIIGGNPDPDIDSYWNGLLDISRIYKRTLSKDEIIYNFKYPEKRFCSACFGEDTEVATIGDICYQCERCNLQATSTKCIECSSCRQYGLVFDSNTANIKSWAWGAYETVDGLFGLGWVEFSPDFGSGLYRSYISAKYGSIYSRSNIGSGYSIIPPSGYFNATYMIQANGHLMNWVSEQMLTEEGTYDYDSPWLSYADSSNYPGPRYDYPKIESDYGNILGELDYNGLINGLYGEVVNELPEEIEAPTSGDRFICLDGKVYTKDGDFILKEKTILGQGYSYEFENCFNGAGTMIIDGNLRIEGNIEYSGAVFDETHEKLASAAWIIKGDLIIDPDVTKLAGTFIVLGGEEDGESIPCGSDLENPAEHCGTIYTGDSNNQLQVSGQFLAKNFQFQRTYKSAFRVAAEEIIYDGRNVINPAPGLGDVLKSLPRWDQISPYYE